MTGPRVRATAPWIIALLLLLYLFNAYSPAGVFAATRQANPGAFAAFVVVYFALFSLADCVFLRGVLRAAGVRCRLREVLRLRLAANLGTLLNHAVGQGVFAYLLHTTHGTPLVTGTGVLVLTLAADLAWALTLACLGTFVSTPIVAAVDLTPWIRGLWATACAVWLVLPWLLARALRHRDAQWTGRQNAIAALARLMPGPFAVAMIKRLPLHMLTTTYLYFLALCFGVHVPLMVVIALLPLVTLVAVLPLTPSGLGTAQLGIVTLFHTHVSGHPIAVGDVGAAEVLLAMSLLFTASVYLMKLICGAACLRRPAAQVASPAPGTGHD